MSNDTGAVIPSLDELRDVVALGHLPSLLMTTAHLTGEPDVLRDEWKPDMSEITGDGGYSDAVRLAIIAYCSERLHGLLSNGGPPPREATFDEVRNAAVWLKGRPAEPLVPLFQERLVFSEDPCTPTWSLSRMNGDHGMTAAIIGAGESGLLAAYRFKQAGIPFKIYERSGEIGGTWASNRYPGARVDVNSFVYCYSFKPRVWENYYPLREDVVAYLRDFAVENDIVKDIEFNSEVVACRWDEDTANWDLDIRNPNGNERRSGRILISAVGQLSRKKMPQTIGMEEFKGRLFHSSEWPDDLDVSGKRVAVIGNGATAIQIVPEVAKTAKSISIFYRNPTWLYPEPRLYMSVPDAERWLMKNLPHYLIWYRAFTLIPLLVGSLEMARVDPDYPPTEHAVSQANADLRSILEAYIDAQIAGRPELRPLVIPDSPFAAKRYVYDDGAWLEALQRENVELIREGILRIDDSGIVTNDQQHHNFDIIVYATGFEASKFLMPMQVEGRGGVDLHKNWNDDARAYLGATVPGFPNLFIFYGPNTNFLVHGASIINLSECTMNYVMDSIRFLVQSGHRSAEVKSRVYEQYNTRVDSETAGLAWGWSKVSSWYKNSKGRVTQNQPFPMYEYHERLKTFEPTEYNVAS